DRARLAPAQGSTAPWVPAKLVARLAQYAWPGNVRELANVALQFAIRNRDEERGQVSAELDQLLARSLPPPAALVESRVRPAAPRARKPGRAGGRAAYPRARAAAALGVPRPSLPARGAPCEGGVRAAERGAAEVRAALDEERGDAARAAPRLRVSKRAL